MIKEKIVEILVVGRTVKKYKSLGYECEVGQKLNIKIQDLSLNSHEKITAICDKCNKERKISYYAYNKNFKKYNYYSCNDCKQEKIEKTNKKLYGVNRPIQNKKIREKLEQTNFKKYGYTCAAKNKKVKEKIIKTQVEIYGDICTKTDKYKEKIKEINFLKLKEKYDFVNIKSLDNGFYEIECDKNHTYKISTSNLYNRLKYDVELCTICNPLDNRHSNKELQLLNFIKDIYSGEIITSDRKILNGKELDIYLPEIKLAFEFNGLYWHSELNKEKNYHLNKTKECKKQNINLFHIYEDEWIYKQEIVKSMIRNKLHKTLNKIYARKTIIKNVSKQEADNFYEKNHIQGKTSYSINVGLYYNDILVSLMSFKNNKTHYELVRFANQLNISIIGGASKLLKYFIKKYTPSKIVSFSNNNYSYGDLYKTLNFEIEKILLPDYSYIVDNKRKHKFSFRKNKLQKMGFNIENKTEHEICLEHKIYRIYDSGKIKWVLNIK